MKIAEKDSHRRWFCLVCKDGLKKSYKMFLEHMGLLPSTQLVKPIFINVIKNGANSQTGSRTTESPISANPD